MVASSDLRTTVCCGRGHAADLAHLLCSFLLGFGLEVSALSLGGTVICGAHALLRHKAYVCLGSKLMRESRTPAGHSWVMTRHLDGSVYFWEPQTGVRFQARLAPTAVESCRPSPDVAAAAHLLSKYRSIGCVYNHAAFFANAQASDAVDVCAFDLENGQHWKSIDADVLAVLPKPPAVYLSPSSLVRVWVVYV
jgi:hypothetical protein